MLYSEQMQKVRIICMEKDQERVVAGLHRLDMIDLRKSDLQLSDERPREYSTTLSNLLIRIEGALQMLKPTPIRIGKHIDVKRLLKEKAESRVLERIYGLRSERKEIIDDQTLLDYAGYVARLFSGMRIDFGRLRSGVIDYKAFVADKKAARIFQDSIKKTRIEHEVFVNQFNRESLIFVAYEKGRSIDEVSRPIKLNELDLTARYLEGTPAHVLESVKRRKNAGERRLGEISSELGEISSGHYSRLVGHKEMLEIELARAEVLAFFKKTDKAFVIEGWIPRRLAPRLDGEMAKLTSRRYYIESIETEELAPTYLRRPRMLQPFDFLMHFYSTPRSDEIDPTWAFIFSFPIFYGLMLSDVGYGVLSFLFVTWVTRITNPNGLVYNTAKIWRLTSVSAILFGFLSNEYFGIGLNQYFTTFRGFDWFANVTTLIVVTVLMGVAQVVAGLLFGFANCYRRGEMRHALSKLASVALVLSGTLAVAGAFFGVLSSAVTISSAVAAIISLVLAAGLNMKEASELTSLIAHPLSYSRVMGFGLASVILALLIDKAFTPTLSHGILVFILYLIPFSVLHFLNMILGIFEGAVQSARLNFVEFFSKFYHGGGIRYNPFSYKRVYTKE